MSVAGPGGHEAAEPFSSPPPSTNSESGEQVTFSGGRTIIDLLIDRSYRESSFSGPGSRTNFTARIGRIPEGEYPIPSGIALRA
jgi:hypothetical protein